MKRFNTTGTCIPARHYMADTSEKLAIIMGMVERGEYFVINRPRQYGKTTTFYMLENIISKKDGYLPIKISFEGIGDSPFNSQEEFCPFFLKYLGKDHLVKKMGLSEIFISASEKIYNFSDLSDILSEIITEIDKKIVLMIDEVDKSSINQLFLHFLGLLRDKYLKANEGRDTTFHSVILAGVHDVKTLKLKLRSDEERKFNSPWNIASDFNVDMSLNVKEIASMLRQYSEETGYKMDIDKVSGRIHFWTSGYPVLVSRLAKMVDEDFLPGRDDKNWSVEDIDMAVKKLLGQTNALFDDMIKNLENNSELYKFVQDTVLGVYEYSFNIHAPWIFMGSQYGILRNSKGKATVHNKIFDEFITNYVAAKNEFRKNNEIMSNAVTSIYLKPDGRLDMKKLVLTFQEVIKEKYSKSALLKSDEFLEKDLRLLFLVFLKPIINGLGFSFKEVETGAEKRLDIVVVFGDEKFIVELKIWYGQRYHEEGIEKMKNYMVLESVKEGYMIIMDKRRSKEFVSEIEEGILMVWI